MRHGVREKAATLTVKDKVCGRDRLHEDVELLVFVGVGHVRVLDFFLDHQGRFADLLLPSSGDRGLFRAEAHRLGILEG